MTGAHFDSLFKPASVAIIGASAKEHSIGKALLANLQQAGFPGPIYPVNPRYSKILQLPAYPSVLAVREPGLLLVSMTGVGIAWASILAMPYAMLANVLPAGRMGFYMGVFNFFIVLPQILASVGLGFVMARWLGNDATQALLLGGVSMLLAAVLTLCVSEAETE